MWASSFLLLVLTYALAAVGYQAGVMLVALPVHSKRLRKLGWMLVSDGAVSVLMVAVLLGFVFFWNAIMNLASPCQSWLPWLPCYNQFAWQDAYLKAENWINGEIQGVEFVGGLISAVGIAIQSFDKVSASVASTFGITFPAFGTFIASLWGNYTAPYNAAITAYIVMLTLLNIWVGWIGPPGNFWAIFLVVGVFLYAIPGRMGRVAAGWLTGTAISFIVAVPFLPGFVDTFTQNVNSSAPAFLGLKALADLFNPVPVVGFPNIFSLAQDAAKLAAAIVLRLFFVGLYVGLIATLNRELARLLAGMSPPHVAGEVR